MSDPPEAEAKPSTSDLPDAVWDRALEAGSLLDAATIAFAAGRAQAAADILSRLDEDREHMSIADAQLVEWAAAVAEGGGEADLSKEQA